MPSSIIVSDLPDDLIEEIDRQARERGIDRVSYVRIILQKKVQETATSEASEEDLRRMRIKAARGSLSQQPGSVDTFLTRKREDLRRELEAEARRSNVPE